MSPLKRRMMLFCHCDQALKQQYIPGYQTYDLASAWAQATALPFVFALFSARKELDTHQLSLLLEEALSGANLILK